MVSVFGSFKPTIKGGETCGMEQINSTDNVEKGGGSIILNAKKTIDYVNAKMRYLTAVKQNSPS